MINKTNQMNLRSLRYNQKEVENLNNKKILFFSNLKDIYGDHGIIGLLIANYMKRAKYF